MLQEQGPARPRSAHLAHEQLLRRDAAHRSVSSLGRVCNAHDERLGAPEARLSVLALDRELGLGPSIVEHHRSPLAPPIWVRDDHAVLHAAILGEQLRYLLRPSLKGHLPDEDLGLGAHWVQGGTGR